MPVLASFRTSPAEMHSPQRQATKSIISPLFTCFLARRLLSSFPRAPPPRKPIGPNSRKWHRSPNNPNISSPSSFPARTPTIRDEAAVPVGNPRIPPNPADIEKPQKGNARKHRVGTSYPCWGDRAGEKKGNNAIKRCKKGHSGGRAGGESQGGIDGGKVSPPTPPLFSQPENPPHPPTHPRPPTSLPPSFSPSPPIRLPLRPTKQYPQKDIAEEDFGSLPTLKSSQRISTILATESISSAPEDQFIDLDAETASRRVPSFVPRIAIPVEDLLARQARARSLKEWSDLDMDLDTSPSFLEDPFEPELSIGRYSPIPHLTPPLGGNYQKGRDTLPQADPAMTTTTKPTRHLWLRKIGTTPLPSDIYRLIPNKEHIPRWRNEEAGFAAFWGRCPRTMNKDGGFHLIWSDSGTGNKDGTRGPGVGAGEKRAEVYRRHFMRAVMEGDRYPAAVIGKEGATPTRQNSNNSSQTAPNFFLSQTTTSSPLFTTDKNNSTTHTGLASPVTTPTRPCAPPLLCPHQTVPLPHPVTNPSSTYLPPSPLLHGSLIYLHFLTTSRPPCPPGCAVLLTTSCQGGSTPESGKLPRTREILSRLHEEGFELIGTIVTLPSHFPSSPHSSSSISTTPSPSLPISHAYPYDPAPVPEPDAAGVGGVSGLDVLGEKDIANYGVYIHGGPWITESVQSNANEEKFGVVSFRFSKDSEEVFPLSAYTCDTSSSSSGGGGFDIDSSSQQPRFSKKFWQLKQKQRRLAREKRGVEGAEGKWVVRLASRTEAGRLVRAWHMREFWTGVGGYMAQKVVMMAEIL